MRSVILIFICLLLYSCDNKPVDVANVQWEYNIVSLSGSPTPKTFGANQKEEIIKRNTFSSLNYPNSDEVNDILNFHGKEGWELVDIYTTIETVFPNFGNEDLHNGIKDNTRTNTVNFVFKRIKQK